MFRPDRLTTIRKRKRITQEALASMVNLTKAAISNYETGRSVPPHETLIQLANVFEVSTDYLLGISDEDSPQHISENTDVPDFATYRDKKDFKKFLEQQEVMFDGVPLTDEEKARVLGYMESMFWDAKKMNKRKKPSEADS